MMEFEIVIRHLKVRYVDLENMGNGRKSDNTLSIGDEKS